MSIMRIVMHIDFDSFYASLEENRNPALKGKPIVICMFSGRTEDSGAVATANYTARELGIKAGLPISKAKLLANAEAVFLPADLEYYRSVSDEIMDVLHSYASKFEQRSIDEAYMDVSEKSYQEAETLAKNIKDEIKGTFGITCSVGIAPNKLIAKIASRFRKPDGLTIVKPEDVKLFISPMNVDKIHGVGSVTVTALKEMDVETVEELFNIILEVLIQHFGESKGKFLYNAARGIDDSPVDELERKQYSRIGTLKENTRDISAVMELMNKLIEPLHEKLIKNKIWFKTISIIAITTDLQLHTKSMTLPAETNSIDAIKQNCLGLMQEFLKESPAALRRCGVRVSSLSEKKQFSLKEF